ncbi:YbaB/EbfC family nucleoid-associated protein [Streptacidiphilus sp. PB12-B1b]|uniref:YbaB/EbfC family nucleoid-associated protein n=1 Tax=Streptacidiphilus sp. PB12-B1b TaxID=2705012 RepID=UPI0015FC98C6|nr:YbaB/EbfC family nucleoid-associated protein [Streptacidiphilus sp. PB12-B1b]QMU77941.1 YbaB/EbfC family nucleoid-associated protein [Streptacidiphilus sp. PB12-B1b]
MSQDAEQRLQGVIDSYRQKRDGIMEMRRRLSTTEATIRSRDRQVSVTVDALGQLKTLKFDNKDYQSMEPGELSALILGTLEKARASVRAETGRIMAPFLPQGTSFDDLSKGQLDWDRLLPESPRTPEQVRELLTLQLKSDAEADTDQD